MTHVRAGEQRGRAGLSPARDHVCRLGFSDLSTQPFPTVSLLAGEEGQVSQRGVLPGSTTQTLPRTRPLLNPPCQELFSMKIAQCD